ncbi:MAG: MEMO1 family protein [Candidatus Magasanikbacteria bacterium]|nr:MEMO1 family protein [Candidatus Magasanikbacteria bacterium]
MPLVFGAIVPHSPVLVPSIGGSDRDKVIETIEALSTLEENLYLSKPHLIIIFTPHFQAHSDTFAVNAHTKFTSSFEEFGDHSLRREFTGSPDFAAKIAHTASRENIPLKLVSEEKLDHGSTVPLYSLVGHLPQVKVLPIGPCDLDSKTHLNFGNLIKEACMDSDKRIALIASANLSHGITTDSPAGFRESGKKFDEKIIELLQSRNTSGIATLDPAFVESAAETGYKPLLMLLGSLKNINYEFKHLAYEHPFGVGYLTAEFVFS